MSNRMSRRAILVAMGSSPVLVAAGCNPTNGEEPDLDAVSSAVLSPAQRKDIDEGMKKAKKKWKDLKGKDWKNSEEKEYKRRALNFWSFFELGVEFVKDRRNAKLKNEGKPLLPLDPADGLLLEAFDEPHDGGAILGSGVHLIINYNNFKSNPKLEKRTEICAWRCGKRAAEIELATSNQTATKVTVDSYKPAWKQVRDNVDLLRSRVAGRQEFMFMNTAGGC